MTPRTATRLGWFLCGVTLAAAVVQFLLRLPRLSELADRYDPFLTFPIITLATLAAAVVGALIVSRHPDNPVGWLFCITNCVAELGLAAEAYAELSGLREPVLPAAGPAAWFQAMTAAGFALSSLVFLLLLFPTGHLPSRRWRVVAWIAGANLLAMEVLTAAIVGSPARAVVLSRAEVDGAPAVLLPVTQLVLIGCLLASVAAFLSRRRRADGEQRQQLRLVAVAAGALAASLVLLALQDPLTGLGLPRLVLETLFYLAYGGLPVAAGLAILKYRLYEIDVILNRAVLVAAFATISTLGYVAVVVAVGRVLGRGVESGVLVSLLATALVAIAVQPARRRLERMANRFVYGPRAAPYEVLASFADRLGGNLALDDVLPRMAAAAAQGVGARAATVRLVLPDGSDRRLTWPQDATEVQPDVVVPVHHAGEPIGEIALELPTGASLDRTSVELLDDLAGQAGLALSNVRLTVELRARLHELSASRDALVASRQRLLAAQADERQRLENRISESVRPHLRAVAGGLDAAERALPDVARAKATSELLAAQVMEALDALRELAHGVFPPLLADRGLVPALRSAMQAGPEEVTLTADDVPRYPAAVETTAYFCCQQLLTDARRVAGGLDMRLSAEPTGLRLVVTGTPPSAAVLEFLEDRVGAAGGTVTIATEPRPTLTMQLPATRTSVPERG